MDGCPHTLIPILLPKMPQGLLKSCQPLLPWIQSPHADILTSRECFLTHFRRVTIRSIQSLGKFCTVPFFQRQAGLFGNGCLPSWALLWLWASIHPFWSTWVLLVPAPAWLCSRISGLHLGTAACRVPGAVVLRYDADEFQAPTCSLLDLRGKRMKGTK